VTSLAAVFCNRWSRFSCVLFRPWSSELHVSSIRLLGQLNSLLSADLFNQAPYPLL